MTEAKPAHENRRANPFNRFHGADVVRAIKAVHAAGLTVACTEITTEGTIRLIHGEVVSAKQETPFDIWRAKQSAR